MTAIPPAALRLLSRSVVIQSLLAAATLAVFSASSPVARPDPAAVSPGPTNPSRR